MPDEAREMIFPQGVPVRMIEADGEAQPAAPPGARASRSRPKNRPRSPPTPKAACAAKPARSKSRRASRARPKTGRTCWSLRRKNSAGRVGLLVATRSGLRFPRRDPTRATPSGARSSAAASVGRRVDRVWAAHHAVPAGSAWRIAVCRRSSSAAAVCSSCMRNGQPSLRR